jgi:dTDP-4-amino-4,6-dideoxygalactose transaminase
MRANHARVTERIGELPALTLRRPNDDGGDAGICVIAFAEEAALAADAVDALRAEGVEATRIYDPDAPDLHVYSFWRPIFDYLADAGRPAPDCPRTLELLGRTIHIDLSPLCDEQDLDEIAFAFEKVANGILA